MPPAGWAVLVTAALTLTGAQLLVVRQHPEPAADEPDVAIKPAYRRLVGPRSTVCALFACLMCLLPLGWLPVAQRPAWAVWASAVLVLVGVDAVSTWLPIRATRLAAVAMVAAVGLAMWLQPEQALRLGLSAAIGAALASALFGALWWFSGSLGFGDVRLAGLTGGLAGLGGLELWWATMLAGTLAAACWGVGTMCWRRRRPSPLGKVFPYGPGLWLGPYLGLLWLRAAGG